MLFWIFSFDSPNEVELRRFNRETHLSYFRTHLWLSMSFSTGRLCRGRGMFGSLGRICNWLTWPTLIRIAPPLLSTIGTGGMTGR